MNDSHPADGRIWLRDYPPDVPADIDPDAIPSLKHVYEEAFRRFAGAMYWGLPWQAWQWQVPWARLLRAHRSRSSG